MNPLLITLLVVLFVIVSFIIYACILWNRLASRVRPLTDKLRQQEKDFKQGNEYAERANAAFARGDTGGEIRHARLAAEHFDSAEQPFFADQMVAQAQAKEGRFLEAADSLGKALGQLPQYLPDELATDQYSAILGQQAGFYRQGGWHSRAYEVAKQALDAGYVRSVGTIALEQAAQLAAYNGDWQEAERFVARALEEGKTDRECREAVETLSYIRLLQGRITEALAANESLIRKDSVTPKVYSTSGMLLEKLGRFDKSATRFQEALARVGEQHPSLVTASGALYCVGLAQTRILQERYTEARELINAAQGVYPQKQMIVTYIDSLSILLDSVAGFVPPKTIQSRAQILLANLNERMKEIPSRQDALKFYYDPHFFLAEALVTLGDANGCSMIIARFPSDKLMPVSESRYHYLSGLCQEERGDIPGATATYTHVTKIPYEPNERYVCLARERLKTL